MAYNDKMGWQFAMDIDVQALTTCGIAADGGAICSDSSIPRAIRRPPKQVGALVMTLPGLLDKAEARYGDQSLRYAYPLGSWIVEQSTDTARRIVTLQTEDGFGVRFSVPREQQSPLGEAVMAQPKSNASLWTD
jgi:hypothetical protein